MDDFERFWQRLQTSNPALATSAAIRFTPEQFRKAMHVAWKDGVGVGIENAREPSVFESIFGRIF